jgi:outer membrane protein, multidrug efflux system
MSFGIVLLMRIAPVSILVCGSTLLLSACVVGPHYQKPAVAAPAAFVEPGPWKVSAPRDHLPKGTWWAIYSDPVLDRLVSQANNASPTIAAALARRDQARAAARLNRADLFPQVSLNPSAERGRDSANARTNTSSSTETSNTFILPLDLSYELDLWGRVRRANESARARAAASEADYHNVLLGVQTDVARAYFALRSLDLERSMVSRNRESRQRALEIVNRRLELGATAELDVSLAQTELATSESDLIAIDQDRASLRYTLAVLCGQMPESFSLEENTAPLISPPPIPIGLPSELLERRPDVASAERTLAATNAQIGVAKAAFFPAIGLTGTAGYRSSELDSLLKWDSRQWAFGPSLSLPIFEGGRNRANYQATLARYDEALAGYRQSLLVAFSEVETALSDLRRLADRGAVLDRAVTFSRRAADLVMVRYRGGQIGYLDVTAAERTAIANERLAVQVRGQHLISSVLLVKALGGGW